jgi:phosphatidylglycerophosphatase A
VRPEVARALATVGGLGDRLPAPGTTVGSLAALLAFLALARLAPGATAPAALVALAVLLPLSVWACGAEAARRGEEDPGPIVLDEVAGQWAALALLALALGRAPRPLEAVGAYVLFRVLDVAKPWPIRRLERLPGGWGIVADDLAAGLAAGAVELALLRLVAA